MENRLIESGMFVIKIFTECVLPEAIIQSFFFVFFSRFPFSYFKLPLPPLLLGQFVRFGKNLYLKHF